MSDFHQFNFAEVLGRNIDRAGFKTPTPIQKEAIPLVLEGKDILGLAQTGTGKTAAFVLPTLHRLFTGHHSPAQNAPQGQAQGRHSGSARKVRALIIAPTRELAEQINQVIQELSKETRLKSITIYGGASMNRQFSELKQGPDIVVACPGRLLDHMQRKTINLSSVETLILDEADQMFDMGFLPAIKKIIAHLPQSRQTLLFSATMPDEIRKLSQQVLKNPMKVELARGPVATISHALYPVTQELKTALLLHLLKDSGTNPILIFTKTKHKASKLAEQVSRAGYTTTSLQGNLSQNRRAKALEGFKAGQYQILVATDIAARGIDVNNISHIINYDVPANSETYVHRIGRTARASKSGEAYTFITGGDKGLVRDIEKSLGKPIEKRIVKDFDYQSKAPILPVAEGFHAQRPAATAENSRPKGGDKPRRQRFRGFAKR